MVEALKLEDKLLRMREIVLHEASELLLFVIWYWLLLTLDIRDHQLLLHAEHLCHNISYLE